MAFRRRLRSGTFVRRRYRKRTRLSKRKPKLRRPVRQAVQRQVLGLAEKKTQGYGGAVDVHATNGISWVSQNIIPLTPYSGYLQIQQGVKNGERLGNKVKLSKFKLRLSVLPRIYSATNNPCPRPVILKVWLVTMKEGAGTTKEDLGTIAASNWLQAASGLNIALSGSMIDLVYPYNTEALTIHKAWEFKIGRMTMTWGDTGGAPAGSQMAGNSYFANNDFKSYGHMSVDITKYLPKNWTWDENLTYYNGKPYYVVFDCVPADGVPLFDGESIVRVHYRLDCKYTDF